MISSLFSVLVVIVVVSLESASGDAGDGVFKCYECNSGSIYDGTNCSDIKSLKKEDSDRYIKNCLEYPPRDNLNYTRCRTMVQEVEGETRLIRSCATKPADSKIRCIDRTGTARIKIRYCECESELCNSARASCYFSFATIFILVVSFFLGSRHT